MKLLSTLLLIGCGTLPDGIVRDGLDNVRDATPNSSGIDPLLAPDFNLFMQRCARSKYMAICEQNAKKIKSIKVVDFVTTEKPAIGVCYTTQFGRRIEVVKWKALEGGLSLRLLMWHELAHCVMGFKHNDTKRHIMNSYDFPVQEGEWDSLVDDLFE